MAGAKKSGQKTESKGAVSVQPTGKNAPHHPAHWEKLGRPSRYSEELAKTICDRIAGGETLMKICSEPDMPGRVTVLDWLKLHDNFRALYIEARGRQGDHTYDKMVDLEDAVLDGSVDPQAARVVLWSRQWRAARTNAMNYSEKVINEHTGRDGGPIRMESTVIDAGSMTSEERDTLRALLQAAKARKEGA